MADNVEKFTWVPFYEEFAHKLLEYKDNRKELVEKIYKIYEEIDMELPSLEKDNKLIDIDPFTIFGLFNKQINERDRLKIIKKIADLFEIEVLVPIFLDGIPILNNRTARYYCPIGKRRDKDIDNLWCLFEMALAYADKPTEENRISLLKCFDVAKDIKGNSSEKITKGLHWINPNLFLNLDERSKWYIFESGRIDAPFVKNEPKERFSAIEYFEISDKVHEYLESDKSNLKDFKELSYEAWRYSEEVNKKKEEEVDEKSEDEKTNKQEKKNITGKNVLFYGVPGCGKSYHINYQYGVDNQGENCERVVFHPDYTYSDFVGQILPRVREGKITYEFVAGPFTKLLKKAIQNPDKHYYLIIEEINRGNAAAIFGDIFQLLDRKNGESEYKITNGDIAESVYGEGNGDNNVYIPRNMSILATMNTADQNVFTLDTAFQRRWQMEHIPNDFDDAKNKSQCEQIIPGNDGISWGEFAKRVNEKILQSNSVFGSTADKSLGVYFIKPEEFEDADSRKIFAEKVLKYLWDDAFKMNHDEMFNKNINSLAKALKEYETTDSLKTVFVEGFFSVKESEDGSNK